MKVRDLEKNMVYLADDKTLYDFVMEVDGIYSYYIICDNDFIQLDIEDYKKYEVIRIVRIFRKTILLTVKVRSKE